MADPGIDPETALQLIRAVLYWVAYIFAGFALVGLSAYIIFLCLEIFAPQRRSKARRAKVPPKASSAPDTKKNLDLSASETPIPVKTRPAAALRQPWHRDHRLPHPARRLTGNHRI